MTEEIAREITEFKTKKGNKFIMSEVHGQEGAAPGTTAGAPTDEALRAMDPLNDIAEDQQVRIDQELDDLNSEME